MTQPLLISKKELSTINDLPHIESDMRAGKILFIKVKSFFDRHAQDVGLLKNSMDQLQKMSKIYNGDMGRIGDDLLVFTPHRDNISLF